MSVTQIKEIAAGRDGEESSAGIVRYKRVFRVRCSDPYDNAKTVRDAVMANTGSTPADAFPGDSSAWPRKYSEMQEHDALIWLAEIEYSNENTDPLDEPCELETSGQMFQRPMVIDYNGDPVVNTAGMPLLNPPVEVDDARGIITFKKNVSAPPAWIYTLYNTTNTASFSIWSSSITVAADTAKLREPPKITGPHTRNGTTYYTVSGTIEVDRNGWDAKALNAGWMQVDPSNSANRIACRLNDGTEPQEPCPLDASGYQIMNPSASNIIILEFQRYASTSWSSLVALLV